MKGGECRGSGWEGNGLPGEDSGRKASAQCFSRVCFGKRRVEGMLFFAGVGIWSRRMCGEGLVEVGFDAL